MSGRTIGWLPCCICHWCDCNEEHQCVYECHEGLECVESREIS